MSDENGETEAKEPIGVGAVLVDTAQESETLQCARCGDRCVRQRSRIASVFINLASFVLVTLIASAAFLLVAYVVTQIQWRRGLRMFSIVFMLPCCLVLAVIWSKLLADCRCLTCGRRFRAIRFLDRAQAQRPFPLRFCILNGIVLFATLAASQDMVRAVSRGSVSGILVLSLMPAIGAVFLAGLSLAGHGFLYVILCRRVKNELLWAIVFVLPAIFFGHFLLHESFPVVTARILLSNGELAGLPESARDIKVYHWSSLFAGQEYLRFAAEPNDIQEFLVQSPALKGKESRRYKIEPMHRSVPEDAEERGEPGEVGREIYGPHPNGPDWYKPGFHNPVRRYEIQPKDYQLPGEVIVDDERHVVYVYLCFS